jgi:hypothetical protein
VIDDELALAAEQAGERFLAVRRVEQVILADFLPRQFAALLAQRIAGKSLFLGQMRLARGDSFVMGNDLVRLHAILLGSWDQNSTA